MLIRILQHILGVIPFIGIAIALFIAIPTKWLSPKKAVIIGFLGLLFYNLFSPTRCFPHALCFLNRREGLENASPKPVTSDPKSAAPASKSAAPASKSDTAVIAAAAAKGAAQGAAGGSDNKCCGGAGTAGSMSSQVALTNSKISKMHSDVEAAINRLIALTQGKPPTNTDQPIENMIHWSENTPIFEKTEIAAQGALAKEKKKGDGGSKSSAKVSSEEAKMNKYS